MTRATPRYSRENARLDVGDVNRLVMPIQHQDRCVGHPCKIAGPQGSSKTPAVPSRYNDVTSKNRGRFEHPAGFRAGRGHRQLRDRRLGAAARTAPAVARPVRDVRVQHRAVERCCRSSPSASTSPFFDWVSLLVAVSLPATAQRFFQAFLGDDAGPPPLSRLTVVGRGRVLHGAAASRASSSRCTRRSGSAARSSPTCSSGSTCRCSTYTRATARRRRASRRRASCTW